MRQTVRVLLMTMGFQTLGMLQGTHGCSISFEIAQQCYCPTFLHQILYCSKRRRWNSGSLNNKQKMKLGFSVFFSEDPHGVQKSKLLSPLPIILCPHNLLNPVLFSGQRSNITQTESFLWKGCSQVCHLSFFVLLPLNIPNSALLCLGMKSSFMM